MMHINEWKVLEIKKPRDYQNVILRYADGSMRIGYLVPSQTKEFGLITHWTQLPRQPK